MRNRRSKARTLSAGPSCNNWADSPALCPACGDLPDVPRGSRTPTYLALRVFVDNKAATASSSDFATATLTQLVDNAVERARLSGADPFAGLPELEKRVFAERVLDAVVGLRAAGST